MKFDAGTSAVNSSGNDALVSPPALRRLISIDPVWNACSMTSRSVLSCDSQPSRHRTSLPGAGGVNVDRRVVPDPDVDRVPPLRNRLSHVAVGVIGSSRNCTVRDVVTTWSPSQYSAAKM